MDAEKALVSKMVHTGAVDEVVSSGIDQSHFVDPVAEKIFTHCVEHTKKHNAAPSFGVVKDWMASRRPPLEYQFDVVTDSLSFVVEEFIKLNKRRAAIVRLRELSDAVDDPDRVGDIDSLFLEASRSLANVIPQSRRHRFKEMKNRIDIFVEAQKLGKLPGIPMGIPTFDAQTLGIQLHEYVSIVGWQGTGKSTLAQFVLFNAYMNGFTPMMVSLEMEAHALYRRWDVMGLNWQADAKDIIQYHDMKSLNLSPKEMKRWEKQAERAANASNDIIVVDEGRIGPDKIYAEIVRYKPDIVAVDYVSLLDTPRRRDGAMWERVTYLTNELKAIARQTKTPIIGVAQTNIGSAEDGAKLENIAYSRSIGQDRKSVV